MWDADGRGMPMGGGAEGRGADGVADRKVLMRGLSMGVPLRVG